MLKRANSSIEGTGAAKTGNGLKDSGFDVDQILAAGRRQASVITVAIACGVALGLVYIVTTVPQFTATASLLIDSSKEKNNDRLASIADSAYDSGAIDSQVEVLRSDKIAQSVVDGLKLTTDSEFMGLKGTFIGNVFADLKSFADIGGWFVKRPKSDQERELELQRAAVNQLKNSFDVRRIGRTYVLSIDYTSPDPFKAAQIANQFADSYIAEQLKVKFDATRQASGWLEERIAELKQKSIDADLAVQTFAAENGIVTADGKLVGDLRLSDLSQQLVLAQADTAKAEARYNQISKLVNSGNVASAVPDTIDNAVIVNLREKYLASSKLAVELSSRFGPTHLQAVKYRKETDQYGRQIFGELKRLAQSYKSDAAVARAKEKSLNTAMTSLMGDHSTTNKKLVQLRELQREEETYRNLYQSFLQRYQDALQRQSFPEIEARVITAASAPLVPSYPKRSFVLAMSLVLGAMGGVGAAAFREYRDRVFRTAAQVKDELGLEFLGMLPDIADYEIYDRKPNDRFDPKTISPSNSLQRYVLDNPLSSFSETLRVIKVSIDLYVAKKETKIIGILSVLPNEGKSTVAKNFASLLSHLGAKTLLIDGDLRNPSLTRGVARHARVGLLDLIQGQATLKDVVMREPESSLSVIPAVVNKRVSHSSELLSSDGMQAAIRDAGSSFDYIIVDLPPIGPVVDARAAADLFDGFVFVVEWGRTTRHVVQTTLVSDTIIYDKCIGVVYNKVKLDKISLYENYGSKSYYYGHYGNYYGKGKIFQEEEV